MDELSEQSDNESWEDLIAGFVCRLRIQVRALHKPDKLSSMELHYLTSFLVA